MVRSLEDLEKYWFNPQKDPFDGKNAEPHLFFELPREGDGVSAGSGFSLAASDEAKAAQKSQERPMEKIHIYDNSRGATLESMSYPVKLQKLSLDGEWQMLVSDEDEIPDSVPKGLSWTASVKAEVPCSIYTPLMEAGLLPDIYLEKNVDIAREECFKSWWFKKNFATDKNMARATLSFDGVADECAVFLDGEYLGYHAGAFGGPDFEITNIKSGKHELLVWIKACTNHIINPYAKAPEYVFAPPYIRDGYKYMVTPLMNWGLHYVNLPLRGIWRSVHLRERKSERIKNVFVAAKNEENALKGRLDISFEIETSRPLWSGNVIGKITPKNFDGKGYYFETTVSSNQATDKFHITLTLPEYELWWPHGYGDPNLYTLELNFAINGDFRAYEAVTFGIRSIKMDYVKRGSNNWIYNWKFVINGKPMFIRGQNWCMNDTAFELKKNDFLKLMEMCRNQNVNMFRLFGNGVIESDEFYRLCDERGIMVSQDWPISNNTYETRPYWMLEETVVRNMCRLRNHPSLVMWCGGNELGYSDKLPGNDTLQMMGKYAYELDGTRPFHLAEDWGGSIHDYPSYFGMEELEANLRINGLFIGEFGLCSMPNYETVMHYLPDCERDVWPHNMDSVFWYHGPGHGHWDEEGKLTNFGKETMPLDSMKNFIVATQLGQTIASRYTIEKARCGWPKRCTGLFHYKINEQYPGASWSNVDFYGNAKMSYYFNQDAFMPLHACLVFDKLQIAGNAVSLPVHLLDDYNELKNREWSILVKAYDSKFDVIKEEQYSGFGEIPDNNLRVGSFDLTEEETASTPLLIYVALSAGEHKDTTFYWLNFKEKPGCIMNLPRTTLQVTREGNEFVITNTGNVPAVGVHFEGWSKFEYTYENDGYFWLEPSETKKIKVFNGNPEKIKVDCWNT